MRKREPADGIDRSVVDAGLTAYEDAGLSGLCSDGRWEVAVEAMRSAAGGEASASLPDLFTQLASALAAERGYHERRGSARGAASEE